MNPGILHRLPVGDDSAVDVLVRFPHGVPKRHPPGVGPRGFDSG